jgi:hypothetical protein
MRINRWLVFGAILAIIVCVALLVLTWLPRSGINKRNFDRIEVGMTRAEVEAIFGGPPTWEPISRRGLWANDGAYDCATITFDGDWRVVSTDWVDLDDRTHWEKLLDRLPWRKHRTPTFYVIDAAACENDTDVLAK